MTAKPAKHTPNASKPNASDVLNIAGVQYDLNHHTPMMVQYLTMKADYPNALLLYRMGDFYELFFDDARRAAEILDITLTRRGVDKAGNTIAMAGVPFHAADSYMARLIAAGQTVVVCEQIDESVAQLPSIGDKSKKPAPNNTAVKAPSLMRREVVKTLTAGTITDDALISSHQTPTVVAIDIAAPNARHHWRVAVSQMNLAAGTLTTQTLSAADLAQVQAKLLTVLARFAPSECIISESLDHNHSDQNSFGDEWQRWLRGNLDCPIIEVAANDFHPDHAATTLCQQFGVQRLDGLGITDSVLAQTSCAALIHYAQQTQQRHVPQVNRLIREHDDDYLIIDASSQQNLEIFAPVTSGGTSLLSIVNHCKTPMGRRQLIDHMKRPLRDRTRINQRLDAITCLMTDSASIDKSHNASRSTAQTDLFEADAPIKGLRETLATIGDVERISSRIALMSARPRDLRKLADSIDSSQQLSQFLTQIGIDAAQSGLLPQLMQHLPDELIAVKAVADKINCAIVSEPPAHIRDGGMIATGFDDEFDRLTHLHDNIQATLDDMAETERHAHHLPSLKVGFNKVSGFYFELPKSQALSAPEHFIRRQTLKNSERFITDSLKTLETDYLSAQSLALAREKQLYHALLTDLSQQVPELQQFAAAIAQIDVIANWAKLATDYHWQRPRMQEGANQTPHIDISQGRHPVVEAACAPSANAPNAFNAPSRHFVANDCQLGCAHPDDGHAAQLLLITGPNMGGKSTYMRQTALIVLLAHVGSFVPAAAATIGDIDRIFTRIGSADDLAGGKSTFMVEMIETATILNQATEKSLVLMDEVGRGTATTDGLAIAHACVARLLDMGCLTLFATHYFELTQLAQSSTHANQGIRNVHVAASEVDGQLLLLHQIKDGAASSSFGLHVAKMAGIPHAVLADAKHYLMSQLAIETVADTVKSDSESDLAKSNLDYQTASTPANAHNLTLVATAQDEYDASNHAQNQAVTLKNALDGIDPDSLTPKQAHDLLYELKRCIST